MAAGTRCCDRATGTVSAFDVVLLLGGGLVAGVINTIAGGGSMITVGLLVVAGVPGNVANGSNRVGVLAAGVTAAAGFRQLGVPGRRQAVPVLVPVAVGSLLGALVIGGLTDDAFERVFGLLMVPLLILSLRPPRAAGDGDDTPVEPWPRWLQAVVFLAVGVYGGAFQAGIGLVLIVTLARTGLDLVLANSIKVIVVLFVTATALPVFVVRGDIDWGPALVLAAGFAVGGWIGAHATVAGGERLIRGVMVVAVIALAGRLIGFY